MQNSFPLNREIRNHWIYRDSQYFHVWSEMLMTARYMAEPSKELISGQVVELQYGQFVFGRKEYSLRIGISEQRLRTLIKKMTDENMIELVRTYNKFSVYLILNYSKFNQQSNQQSNQHKPSNDAASQPQSTSIATSDQPATNQQLTTYKKEKNVLNKSSRQKRVYDVETIPYRSAKYLLDKIREHKTDLKEPDIQKWADTMRLLIERDNREPIKIAQVIDWCTSDSFWKTNILSADSLRNQWDKLTAKMDAGKSSGGGSQVGRTGQAAYTNRGVVKPNNPVWTKEEEDWFEKHAYGNERKRTDV